MYVFGVVFCVRCGLLIWLLCACRVLVLSACVVWRSTLMRLSIRLEFAWCEEVVVGVAFRFGWGVVMTFECGLRSWGGVLGSIRNCRRVRV